jgi:hypothetical protein
MLIAAFDSVTGIGLDSSSYTLIILFDALSLVAFVLLIKELGGDSRVQLAAIVVLFSLAYMNENRADIIRDHGYWFCYLFSLVFYIKFYKSFQLKYVLLWSITILLGALFRIEGLVIWAMLPLIILIKSDLSVRGKIRYLSMSYLAHFIIGLALVSYLWVTHDNTILTTRLGDFQFFAGKFLDGIGGELEQRIAVLKTHVLNSKYSSDFAMHSIVGIIVIILISKIFTAVTLPYVGIFFMPSLWARLKTIDYRAVSVLVWSALISLLLVLSILIPRLYLSARWALPFAFSVLLFVPFLLVRALDIWNVNSGQRRKRTVFVYLFFGLFILFGFLDGLISTSDSKSHIKDAGDWVKQNLSSDSKIFFNDVRIHHYSGRFKGERVSRKIKPGLWGRYDYIVLLYESDETAVIHAIDNKSKCLSEIKQYESPRGDMVRIFKVVHRKGCYRL